MHVAHNFISLSFDASDANAATTVFSADAVVDGESFNFSAMLQSNVGDEAPGGELLPQHGSELPPSIKIADFTGDVPQFGSVLITETAIEGDSATPEIVASLDINAPQTNLGAMGGAAIVQPGAVREALVQQHLSPAQSPRAESWTQRSATTGLHTPGLNAAEPQAAREINQTVTQVLAQSRPELGAAVRSIDLQTSSTNSKTARVVTISAPLAPTAAAGVDAVQQLSDLSNGRLQVQPAIASVPGNEVFFDRAARQPNLAATQTGSASISFAAPPPTPGDRPLSPFADVASAGISTPVRDAAWGDRMSQQVLTMASNNTRTAEIRLTPAELGPLRIQVDLDDGKANVAFQSSHAITREAIETALPRLREMLAENGLSLGQANVGERDRADRDHAGAESGNADVEFDGSGDIDTDGQPEDRRERRVSQGLLDAFV